MFDCQLWHDCFLSCVQVMTTEGQGNDEKLPADQIFMVPGVYGSYLSCQKGGRLAVHE